MWLPDTKQLARYMELSQIGLEMVAPIGLGALLDHWMDWGPWAMIAGAILGLITGMIHLITFLKRKANLDSPRDHSQRGQPPKGDAGP